MAAVHFKDHKFYYIHDNIFSNIMKIEINFENYNIYI